MKDTPVAGKMPESKVDVRREVVHSGLASCEDCGGALWPESLPLCDTCKSKAPLDVRTAASLEGFSLAELRAVAVETGTGLPLEATKAEIIEALTS